MSAIETLYPRVESDTRVCNKGERLSYANCESIVESEACIVVMPLDNSPHSLYCLQFYIQYLHKPQNVVHVCYVVEGERDEAPSDEGETSSCCKKNRQRKASKPRTNGVSLGVLKELEEQDKENCNRLKDMVVRVFTANQVMHGFKRIITESDTWSAILDFRRDVEGSLIVMGSRGQSTLKKSIFGSVSDKVLKHSMVPVLVIKEPVSNRRSKSARDTMIH
ncbi:uncharacterized protein LOC131952714 isoform X1 [Physella acuta]|uniref:uncharacterized protein LOC131952714 isoform X1 n=1 Tax=Physella acuta TaxID=109671 RepID=UPI0027DAD42C|nr:uncharacterized protein LOC131952714 isoform X1 [Physella acuta]